MRGLYHTVLPACRFLGFDPRTTLLNFVRLPGFVRQMYTYRRLNHDSSFRANWRDIHPILTDSRNAAGQIGGAYFHQDLWAARKIFCQQPSCHVDIGSRIDGFISHLLVFMPVTLVDIRAVHATINGLTFVQDDATELSMFPAESVVSLSSLHAAEHFGLGRYSDPVDPSACTRFMKALQRVLAPGGRLYFSVPIGRQRVEFNAHRIFDVQTVLNLLDELKLVSFSYVGDDGQLYENVAPHQATGLDACGLFEFTKVLP